MAINRFYQPSQAQYVSQFVPNKMPFDLMLAGLERKQKQYDTQDALQNQILGDWKLDALEGYDTQRRNELKAEVRGFLDNSMDKDLASPEYQREYLNFVRGLRDNQDIASISNAYATDQAEKKRIEELKKSNNPYEYIKAMEHEYNQRRSAYTLDPKLGGKGFKGDVKLGDPTILAGVDKNKIYEEFFDQLKANAGEQIKFLEPGLSYKIGIENITDPRIKERVNETLGLAMQSPAGRQAAKEFDMMKFPEGIPSIEIEKLGDVERKKYFEERRDYIAQEFFNVGLGFTYQKGTTNADQAINRKWDFGNQQALLYPNQPIIEVAGTTQGTDKTFKADMAKYQSRKTKIQDLDWQINNYEAAKANPNLSREHNQLAKYTPKQIEDLKVERELLSHDNKQDETKFQNARNKTLTLLDPKIDLNYVNQNGQFKLAPNTYDLTSRLRELDPEIQDNLKWLNNAYESLNNGQATILLDGSRESEVQKKAYMDSFNATLRVAAKKIEDLKKDPKLNENDKKALVAAEQQLRINHQRLRSQIPESAYKDNNWLLRLANTALEIEQDAVFGFVGAGLPKSNLDNSVTGVGVGKETFQRELEKEYEKSTSSFAPTAIIRETDMISPLNMTTGEVDKARASAHKTVEPVILSRPQDQILEYNGKIIKPGDPDYPLGDGEGKIISEDVNKITGSNTPIFMVEMNKPMKGFGNEGKKEKATYRVVATGIDVNSYYSTRKPELLAKVKADPNSPQAIIALNAAQLYSDPRLNQDVTSLANVKTDDKYITNQYESSDQMKQFGENFHIEVLKLGDGTYQYQTIYDDTGIKSDKFIAKNLADLNRTLVTQKK